MVGQRERIEHPNIIHLVTVLAVETDIAGESRSLTTDMDHPRYTGTCDQFDDRTAGSRPRRVQNRDIGAIGLTAQDPTYRIGHHLNLWQVGQRRPGRR